MKSEKPVIEILDELVADMLDEHDFDLGEKEKQFLAAVELDFDKAPEAVEVAWNELHRGFTDLLMATARTAFWAGVGSAGAQIPARVADVATAERVAA